MARLILVLSVVVSFTISPVVAAKRRSVTTHSPPTDCPGIQRAIDALPPSGGEVRLLAQTYTCTEPVVLARSKAVLRGAGAATVLRLADGANAPLVILGTTEDVPTTTVRGIIVADMTLDGNRHQQQFECLRGECSAENPLRNNGVTLRRVEDVLVENVRVTGARSGGLVTELGVRRATIRNFTATDSFFDGMAGYETEESVFDGMHLHDNLAAGISLDIAFNHNVITNTTITRTGKVGIFMRDSRGNLFDALQIRDSGEHGVFLAQVDGDATKPAAANTFVSLVVAGSNGAAFRANDASCVDNLVVGAQFIANRDGGVSEVVPGMVEVAGVIVR
jgi:hypothetical protein